MYILDMLTWIPEARVKLYWGDFFDCEPDWFWGVQDLPDLDLWYVMEGAGWITGGAERTPIGMGHCLLLRPGGSYEAGHNPQRPLKLIALHFDLVQQGGKRLNPRPEELPPFIRKMKRGGFFRELLTQTIRCHRDGYREWACAWFQAALMELLHQDAQTWPPGPLGDQARKSEDICERIRRNPGRPVSVEALAAELHVSPAHFCRIFHRLQGVSPRAFITRARVEAAQSLLLTSSHSIARIAELLGYESAFYFSRQFKSKVGLSPTEFRKSERTLRQPAGAARLFPAKA